MTRISAMGKIAWSAVLVIIIGSALPLDFLTELENKYLVYKNKYPYVSLTLTLNQPTYVPGDSVFFSARYGYEDRQPVSGIQFIRLDILAGDGRTMQSIRFKVMDGIGHNQLVILNDIKPGIYKFVAYSDWMRNFGTDAFFQLDVPIVSKQQIVKSGKHDHPLAFHAEGGHLIAGLENRVLVVGPPYYDLILKDEMDAEIGAIKLNTVGTGSFILKPELNKKYHGVSRLENRNFNLPVVENDGVAVRIDPGEVWSTRLAINEKSKYHNQKVYSLFLSQGKILLKQEILLDKGFLKIGLPSVMKANAFHQLFILDSNGKELAQRVFMPTASKDVNVKFRVQENVKQRNNFTFAVGVFDGSDNLIESDMSLSVYQSGLFKDKTIAKSSSLYDLPSVSAWANECSYDYEPFLNDFLISIKWDRINWESVYRNKPPNFPFPFKSQFNVGGKVLSKENGKPAPDSTHVLFYLLKNTMGYEAYTKSGNFEVPLIFNFWGDDIIFCTLRSDEKCADDQFSITLKRDTVDLKEHWLSKETPEVDLYGEYARNRNLISKSYDFFSGNSDTKPKPKTKNEVLEEEFQGVDHTINVADYLVFPTMEDILNEVVTFVQFRKKKSESTVRLFYRYEKSVVFYKQDPLYIIDGVMNSSTAHFLSLKPSDIISIKIINDPNKLSQLGKLGQNGIIFVETKIGTPSKTLGDNLFPVTGLSQPILVSDSLLFKTNSLTKVPKLRSTLYWNPYLKTDLRGFNEITFKTTDDAGPMKIKVEGVTKEGVPFSSEHNFTVQLRRD